jgi:hypothetical protein
MSAHSNGPMVVAGAIAAILLWMSLWHLFVR